MFLLIGFAFLGGIVTILSPCILPILPILLSGTVGGGKQKPLGIVAGFILSFTFFTLALTSLVKATGISADSVRNLAVGVIALFGLFLVWPRAQSLAEQFLSRLSGIATSKNNRHGYWGGILIGISLGLVWAPCVGPILGSVITLALTSQVNAAAVFITIAYAIGTAIPMLLVTYGGREVLTRTPWLLQHTADIQKGFGFLMILTALAIFLNWDRQFQTFILETFPNYGTGLTAIEDNQQVNNQLDALQNGSQANRVKLNQAKYKAPGLAGGGNWLNSEPLQLEELRGKVVLVDFWTYSCINCIRTFPYLKSWWEKYQDKGLVIIGVHSPEFEFEKDLNNLTKATADFELPYPIVQDNDFLIWRAYQNRFWPAKYLIDKDGYIRYTHFGEGEYAQTENAIRELLDEEPLADLENPTSSLLPRTPETYLGYSRAESYLRSQHLILDEPKTYQLPDAVPLHGVGLGGDWIVTAESIQAVQPGARLDLHFLAREVYLVLSSNADQQTAVTVLLDGQPIKPDLQTADYNNEGKLVIQAARKYDLLQLPEDGGEHVLSLIVPAGVNAFAFTFGR